MAAFLSVVPSWVPGALVMIVTALVVLGIYRWLTRWLIRLAGRRSPFLQRLLQRGQGPASAFVIIFALGTALPAARFSFPVFLAVGHVLLVAFILTVGWAAAIAIDVGVTIYLRRFRTDVEDNLLARKHITQMRILQRVATILLAILTIASALMTFASVRQYGVSLFASAGAAGIIVGLSARPLLSNIVAGIQIAMTQPIRVEDQVVVQGETGWIEKITSTYVVIRIWDLRRMIVPLSYFIENPFQNWTYESTAQIGAVLLHVNYSAPVDRLRQKLDQVLRESELWDGRAGNLQVTDTTETTLQLRALVSARTPGQTWDLRCEVREKLIAFLAREYPHALPGQSSETVAPPGDQSAGPAPDGSAADQGAAPQPRLPPAAQH
jgi:small-conductance mechanosensitive channel